MAAVANEYTISERRAPEQLQGSGKAGLTAMNAKVGHDHKRTVPKQAGSQVRTELKWNQDFKQHPAQRSVRLASPGRP